MCHFITATLPPSARVDAVAEIAAGFRRAWSPIESGPVAARLPVGETYYFTTSGHCDCGTSLGCVNRAAPAGVDYAHKINKRRRDGWSETKIDRWLADKRQADIRRHESEVESAQPDALGWFALLRTIVSSDAAATVGLLLHFYSGSVFDEQVQFDRARVSLSNITPEFLLKFEEDRLYEFSA